MKSSAPRTFDQSQVRVEGLMEQGAEFSNVEDAIDTAPLSRQHKAALWLLAWSLRDSVQQRHDARLMVAAVGADRREAGGGRSRREGPRGAAPMLRVV